MCVYVYIYICVCVGVCVCVRRTLLLLLQPELEEEHLAQTGPLQNYQCDDKYNN